MKPSPIRSSYLLPALLVLVILLVLFLPVSIPSSISSYGRIVPAREWYLAHDGSGRITVTLNDRVANTTTALLVHQFERQDAVRFDLRPGIMLHTTIAAGDTVGTVSSAETELQRAELEGELAKANATLHVYETGEKASVLKEAEERIAYMTAQYEGHRRTLERMKTLLDRGIISRQDFETVETASDLYKADIELARANLRRLATGAKPAQIEFGNTSRTALQGRLEALRRKTDRCVLIAPFTGTVLRAGLSDTLFSIGDTRKLAVVLSVPWQEMRQLREGQEIKLQVASVDTQITASIRTISNVVRTIRMEQVVLVTALIEHGSEELLPGVNATCSIDRPPTRLRTVVFSFMKKLFAR